MLGTHAVRHGMLPGLTVSFEVGAFSSGDPILDELEEATLEIESEGVISRVDDLQIEYVVRNTSDLEYSGLTPKIAVWDTDWLFCEHASASVYTAIPAGLPFDSRRIRLG